jgi:hypothetical protein
MEVMRMETTEFKDVRFMTAAEKRKVLRQWVRFLKSGFEARLFMKSLYHHLIQHCSFIAHYNLGGFYGVYFEDPSATQRFLDQFDRSKGCLSVEYGYAWWINDEDYRDINNAMVDAATEMLPELRRMLKERETAKARQELEQAERRLKTVLATE